MSSQYVSDGRLMFLTIAPSLTLHLQNQEWLRCFYCVHHHGSKVPDVCFRHKWNLCSLNFSLWCLICTQHGNIWSNHERYKSVLTLFFPEVCACELVMTQLSTWVKGMRVWETWCGVLCFGTYWKAFVILVLVSLGAIALPFSLSMIKVYTLYHQHSKLAHLTYIFNTLSC